MVVIATNVSSNADEMIDSLLAQCDELRPAFVDYATNIE